MTHHSQSGESWMNTASWCLHAPNPSPDSCHRQDATLTHGRTKMEKKIGDMDAAELQEHINKFVADHKLRLNSLRALQRAKAAEEAASAPK